MRNNSKKCEQPEFPVRLAAAKAPAELVQGAIETKSFPIYILHLDPNIQITFPENRKDLDHLDYWEQTVCFQVARHFGIPSRKLANLPYCQRRARIVGNKVLYGEKHDPELLRQICEALGNSELFFCYDDHEKRLRGDVRQFRKLIKIRNLE